MMNAPVDRSPETTKNRTSVERTSDREVVVTRIVDAPPRIVFDAFARAELLRRWWVPESMGMKLVSCEVDARIGGTYRLTFDFGGPEPMAFFGTYVEVEPPSRLAWTNEEGGEGAASLTTVTFEDLDGRTRVVVRETHPSKEALDAAGGAAEALVEAFEQLDRLVASMEEVG